MSEGGDDRNFVKYRLDQLDKRVGRIENFILGVLCMFALAIIGGLFALINLPNVPKM